MQQGGHILWCPFLAASQMQWDTWTPVTGTLRLMCCWQQVSAGGPEIKKRLASLLRQHSSPQWPQMSLWTWIKVMGNVCPLWAASWETDELARGSYREILSEHRVIVLWLLERKWNIQYDCNQEMPWPRKSNPSELLFFLSFSSCLCIALVIHQDREMELRSFVAVG